MGEQRDVLSEVLAHLGLDPADVPAETLAAVRASLEGPLDPRALAAKVPRGSVARGYVQPPQRRRSHLDGEDLDQLGPRELARRVMEG